MRVRPPSLSPPLPLPLLPWLRYLIAATSNNPVWTFLSECPPSLSPSNPSFIFPHYKHMSETVRRRVHFNDDAVLRTYQLPSQHDNQNIHGPYPNIFKKKKKEKNTKKKEHTCKRYYDYVLLIPKMKIQSAPPSPPPGSDAELQKCRVTPRYNICLLLPCFFVYVKRHLNERSLPSSGPSSPPPAFQPGERVPHLTNSSSLSPAPTPWFFPSMRHEDIQARAWHPRAPRTWSALPR